MLHLCTGANKGRRKGRQRDKKISWALGFKVKEVKLGDGRQRQKWEILLLK